MTTAIDNTREWDPASEGTPTTPTSLVVAEVDTNTVTLQWNASKSSDFDTYEVWMDTLDHIDENTSWMVDSGDYSRLCWAANRYVTLGPLEYRQTFTFAVRGRDNQDRLSGFSNEVSGYADDLHPPLITILTPFFKRHPLHQWRQRFHSSAAARRQSPCRSFHAAVSCRCKW